MNALPMPQGLQILRMRDLLATASAGTADAGEATDAFGDALKTALAGAAEAGVTLTRDQARSLIRLFDALDAKVLAAHEAVGDAAEAYSEGVR